MTIGLLRPRGRAWCNWIVLVAWAACAGMLAAPAHAGINLLAPGRVVDASGLFRLTLMVTSEADNTVFRVPAVLPLTLTPDLGGAVRIDMRRETVIADTFTLQRGEFRRIDYVGEIPTSLRGRVRIDAVDVDAPPMLVQLIWPQVNTAVAAVIPAPAAAAAALPADTAAGVITLASPPASPFDLGQVGRLSLYNPMFFVAGPSSDANAQMQFSFKMHLHEPRQWSRAFLDNIYFGYTQTSFWDLTSESKPFLDTSYRPSFFYYVADTGWQVAGHGVGVETGYEHESNGKGGDDSRSIDSLYVKPIFTWGDPRDFYLTFQPKLFVYLDKSENDDIQKYRGFGDFRFTYGSDKSWQLAATLRKGTKSEAYNIDAQWTYPLNVWVPGLTGYLMLQVSNGWGETLLNYNVRESTVVRAGYAISR